MNDVTSGKIDIYAELGVSPTALSSEIATKYRQKALQYHPDKNPSPEAAETFRFFSAINSVLLDPSLRRQYDDIRKQRVLLKRNEGVSTHIENEILRFREQLRQREFEAQEQNQQPGNVANAPGVEILAVRGLEMRRKLQAKLQQKQGYTSFRDIQLPEYTKAVLVKDSDLIVKWKFRLEPNAQINSHVLQQIFEVFGPVKCASVLGNDGRYVRGLVSFQKSVDTQKALEYNYLSAALWNGSPLRKLASLLRGVLRQPKMEESPQSLESEIDSFLRSLPLQDEEMVDG